MRIPWACPYCQNALSDDLACACGFRGYTANGMYHLHRDDDSWRLCTIERDGWIGAAKERHVYFDNQDHYDLPDGKQHLRNCYGESKAHLDALLRIESLNGKLCLDLGACLGWVEAYLLRHAPETRFIALDVNDDAFCGLGRSQAIRDHWKVEFDSVVGDMHHIPLSSGSVDVVFSVDALHHFRDLAAVFAEVRRVLRPGGRFYGLNEPDRPEDADESAYVRSFIEVELRHGIIERRPTLQEYLEAGRGLGVAPANEEIGLRQHVDTAGLFLKGVRR